MTGLVVSYFISAIWLSLLFAGGILLDVIIVSRVQHFLYLLHDGRKHNVINLIM